jgi:dolichol-phosphate mannosyltransferase
MRFMPHRFLTALPVYNEVAHVAAVLDEVCRSSADVLVVDDGSSDGTLEVLQARSDIRLLRHARNRGYGAALKSAFDYAVAGRYDVLVTIDCDGQHEPQRIPEFVAACTDDVDIVSGSRYLQAFVGDSAPPADRRRINRLITEEVNRRFGLKLTDAFCGFKAYRVPALECLDISEPGYAMPLELWVQAKYCGLRIVELPVPLIYLDEKRSFGGALDDAQRRLAHYREVIERSEARFGARRRDRRSVGSSCA